MIISSRRVRVLKHILIVPIIITMHAKFKFFLHCLKFIYIMNAPPEVAPGDLIALVRGKTADITVEE